MKKIVVLGAGFGGLRTAIQISKKLKSLRLLKNYEVILIDKNDHHTYTPLLYEAATTSPETADLCDLHGVVAHKLTELTEHLPVTFIQSEIMAIDFINGKIKLANNEDITCDYAVLALGSEANYFNIKGLKENSLPFKTLIDAVRIRNRIFGLAEDNISEFNIIIGGGGSTGVELAGELKMWCGDFKKKKYRKCPLNITIIEGAQTILPDFSQKIIGRVKKRLDALGVRYREQETIQEVEKKKIFLKSGEEIKFDLFIWAGGVKAPLILAGIPLKTEARGRVETFEKMECIMKTPDLKIYPMIYAIGDNTCMYDPKTQKPIPGVARAAIDEADVAAHNLIEEIKAAESENYKPKAISYKPREYPYVIPVGGKFAVVKIGPLVISGFFAWVFKGLIELNYLLSIMPMTKALRIWLKGLKIFIQNDRLG